MNQALIQGNVTSLSSPLMLMPAFTRKSEYCTVAQLILSVICKECVRYATRERRNWSKHR